MGLDVYMHSMAFDGIWGYMVLEAYNEYEESHIKIQTQFLNTAFAHVPLTWEFYPHKQRSLVKEKASLFCSFCTIQGKKARDIKVQQDPRFNAMHSRPTPPHPIPSHPIPA